MEITKKRNLCMNYNMVGDAIVKHCGGLANFIHVTNCMTRVRMT
ncbi:PTS transporter subunit EIIB, partial [Klebsiella pneumoniae]